MTLMSLVRWIGVLAIVWTLLAIGLGASGTHLPNRPNPRDAAPATRDSVSLQAMPAIWPYPHDFVMIDRKSGQKTPMVVPPGETWSNISISPWPGPDGEIEAVGRWVDQSRDEFGGWAVFRPSDGEVLYRVPAELLANGRPCWVPGQPRMIVFSAGDGRLYRCRLASSDDPISDENSSRRIYASGRTEPSDPIEWRTTTPGAREPLLLDPLWPSEPSLRRWLLVSLVNLETQKGVTAYAPARLWWLELSDDARSIVAAGPLTTPDPDDTEAARFDQRFPEVVHAPDGSTRLVFEERLPRSRKIRLVSAPIEFDSRTGRPRVSAHLVRSPSPPSREMEAAPFLISGDGATAFAFHQNSQLTAFPIPYQR